MSNAVKKMAKKTKPLLKELSWVHLEPMKEIFVKALELNIALQSFNANVVNDTNQEEMMQRSIYNSQKGLKKINDIENIESLNSIILNIGQENWGVITIALHCISGTLGEDRFYEYDKEISAQKRVGKA